MGIRELKQKPFSKIKNLTLSYSDNTVNFSNTEWSTAENFNFALYEAFRGFNDLQINNYSLIALGKKGKMSGWLDYDKSAIPHSTYITPIWFTYNNSRYFLYFDENIISPVENTIDEWETLVKVRSEDELLSLGVDLDNLSMDPAYLFIIEYKDAIGHEVYIKHLSGAQEYYMINRKFSASKALVYTPKDDLRFNTNKEYAEKYGTFTFYKTDDVVSLSLSDKEMIKIYIDPNDHDKGTYWINSVHNLRLNEDSTISIVNDETSPENTAKYYVPEMIIEAYSSVTITAETLDTFVLEAMRTRSLAYIGEKTEDETADLLSMIDNKNLVPLIDLDGIPVSLVATFYNNPPSITQDLFIDPAWVSYQPDNITHLNMTKSSFYNDTQCMLHFQYNNIDENYTTDTDIVPLKNHVSYKNYLIRGDYMDMPDSYRPNVNFREYTTLDTGSDQEFGNPNISLNYVFYNNEYTLSQGEDLRFTLPTKDTTLEANFDNPLYPFIQLNINDSNFVRNGALGSSTPFLADKVRKAINANDNIRNYRYLYTWLYQDKNNPYGIWLDRYYYPNVISKHEILNAGISLFEGSYSDIIDEDYTIKSANFYNNISKKSYFDKQSDLTFEPGSSYVYSRVSNDDVMSFVEGIKSHKQNNFTKFNSVDNIFPSIDGEIFKETGILDLSYDMFLAPETDYGTWLFGNSSSTGLSVTHNRAISPFIYTVENVMIDGVNHPTLRLHNEELTEIKSVDIYELYKVDEEIIELYIGEPFTDVLVTTKTFNDEIATYVFSYDLYIKERISVIGYSDSKIVANTYENDTKDKYTFMHSYLKDNKVYYMFEYYYNDPNFLAMRPGIDPDRTNHIYKYYGLYHSMFVYDLNTKYFSEITRYIYGSSVLAQKIDGNNILSDKTYPAYIGDAASILTKTNETLNGFTVYEVVQRSDNKFIQQYQIPQGLKVGDKVILVNDRAVYDNNYWYYSPTYKDTFEESQYLYVSNSFYIKNLYIHNGEVLGLPYDHILNSSKEGELYGTRARIENELYQIETLNLDSYKSRGVDYGSADILFGSYVPIEMMTGDESGRLAIVKRNSANLEKLGELELVIFDDTKRVARTYEVGKEYDKIFGLDAIKVRKNNRWTTNFIIFGQFIDKETSLPVTQYVVIDENYGVTRYTVDYILTYEPGKEQFRQNKFTNFTNTILLSYENSIDFTLTVPAYNMVTSRFTYSLDLTNITSGWYNFRIFADLNAGKFSVTMNDNPLPVKRYIELKQYYYNFKNVFNYALTFGRYSYNSGLPLAKLMEININSYDSKNVRLDNILCYSTELNREQLHACHLAATGIGELNITLPGGQRNNLEEIIRYFKYNPPHNVSNVIRINIKNSNITNDKVKAALTNDILLKLSNDLAVPLTIKDINFIS